jgi:hypothetical protein
LTDVTDLPRAEAVTAIPVIGGLLKTHEPAHSGEPER